MESIRTFKRRPFFRWARSRPLTRLAIPLFLLSSVPLYAQQGSDPWDNAVNVLKTAFTGTIATGLSLVAIVVGGLMFAYGEGQSKKMLAGIVFGVGMAIGAVKFLTKPVDEEQLLAALDLAFQRDYRHRLERQEESTLKKRWASLTPRELQVFKYVVAGFLNKQAAAELGITENTLQVHRGRVMRKMEANSLAELVRMSTKIEATFLHPDKMTAYSCRSQEPSRVVLLA